MDDEGTREPSGRDERTAPNSAPPKKSRSWIPMIIAGVLFLPLAAIALWTVITLHWSYSDGTRAGYIQKFSQKGWVCKTWEGEIAISNVPGQLQEKFDFSVRSDSVAAEINKHIGGRVALTYQQHRGVPGKCFGETEYFVTGVKPVN